MARKRKLEASPSADRSDLSRLLEAAKADHWDDGPRLALADWLEENGGEADRARAEVIRLQLDADDVPLAQILPLIPAGVEALHLMAWRGDWDPMFGWGDDALRGLEVSRPSVDDATLARLAASGMARGLERLSLAVTEMLTPAGFSALSRLSLRRLVLRGGRVGGHGLALLDGSPCAEALEDLRLDGCLGPTGRPQRPPRLRRLALTRSAHDADVIGQLGAGGLFDGLAELDLSYNHSVGDDGAAALIAAVGKPPRTLRLYGCGLKDAGARRLAAWPGLAGVRYLDVEYNRIGPAGMRALLESPHAANIEALAIAGNGGADPEAIAALRRSTESPPG